MVNCWDAAKSCNSRSQTAGVAPVYYTDYALTQIYTNGEAAPIANWVANGYRLPTEAEWEKAARGGLTAQRFPLGNTVSENQANYYSCTSCYSYDVGPNGFNARFDTGGYPYTNRRRLVRPNGYGLFDMGGNVFEWCWDWYVSPYAGGTDPHGPSSSLHI